MSKSKDAGATEMVFNYLIKQNRPYSAVDIFNNLHKEHGKTLVMKVLDQLVAEKKIREKTYGKQKVYFADQSQFPELNNDDLSKMDAEIGELTSSISEIELQIKKADAELLALSNSLTFSAAKDKIKTVEQDIATTTAKLGELQSDRVKPISKEEKEAVQKTSEAYNKEWKKRKRIALDVIDAVLENYPKSKKIFYEEVGLEVDE